MKSFNEKVFSEVLKWLVFVMIVFIVLFVFHIEIIRIRSFLNAVQTSMGSLSRMASVKINEAREVLSSALKSGEISILKEDPDYQWGLFLKDGAVLWTDLNEETAQLLLSHRLKKSFFFFEYGGKVYPVVYAGGGDLEGYLALNFAYLTRFLRPSPVFFSIIDPEGRVVFWEGEKPTKEEEITAVEGKKFSGKYVDVVFRGPHDLYFYSRYDMAGVVLDALAGALPMIVAAVFVFVAVSVIISKILAAAVTSPIEKLVNVIETGDLENFESEYREFSKIATAIKELMFRFESVHNGLLLATSFTLEREVPENELYLSVIRGFEDFLPTMFPAKYMGVVYYRIVSGKLERVITSCIEEGACRIKELLDEEVINTVLGDYASTAMWSLEDGITKLWIPVRVEGELKLFVEVYLKGEINKVESFAGESLAIEYNLLADHVHKIYKLNFLATTDYLTHLRNRMYFMNRLSEECSRLKRYPSSKPFAVSVIDLDGLKRVNDTYGHSAGDAYIKTFADYLKKSIRESDVAGRIGGDEFGVIWLEVQPGDVDIIEERFFEGLEKVKLPEYGLKVSASIGTAVYGVDGTDPDELLNVADMRMYKNKESKKSMRR